MKHLRRAMIGMAVVTAAGLILLGLTELMAVVCQSHAAILVSLVVVFLALGAGVAVALGDIEDEFNRRAAG